MSTEIESKNKQKPMMQTTEKYTQTIQMNKLTNRKNKEGQKEETNTKKQIETERSRERDRETKRHK